MFIIQLVAGSKCLKLSSKDFNRNLLCFYTSLSVYLWYYFYLFFSAASTRAFVSGMQPQTREGGVLFEPAQPTDGHAGLGPGGSSRSLPMCQQPSVPTSRVRTNIESHIYSLNQKVCLLLTDVFLTAADPCVESRTLSGGREEAVLKTTKEQSTC